MTTKQPTEKKACCDCGCGKDEVKGGSSKMRKTDKANMVQALKDESSYAKKTLKK